MAYKNIVLEKDEGITKLIIDRPPVNVMDQETLDEITSALKELGKDEETKDSEGLLRGLSVGGESR